MVPSERGLSTSQHKCIMDESVEAMPVLRVVQMMQQNKWHLPVRLSDSEHALLLCHHVC